MDTRVLSKQDRAPSEKWGFDVGMTQVTREEWLAVVSNLECRDPLSLKYKKKVSQRGLEIGEEERKSDPKNGYFMDWRELAFYDDAGICIAAISRPEIGNHNVAYHYLKL